MSNLHAYFVRFMTVASNTTIVVIVAWASELTISVGTSMSCKNTSARTYLTTARIVVAVDLSMIIAKPEIWFSSLIFLIAWRFGLFCLEQFHLIFNFLEKHNRIINLVLKVRRCKRTYIFASNSVRTSTGRTTANALCPRTCPTSLVNLSAYTTNLTLLKADSSSVICAKSIYTSAIGTTNMSGVLNKSIIPSTLTVQRRKRSSTAGLSNLCAERLSKTEKREQ